MAIRLERWFMCSLKLSACLLIVTTIYLSFRASQSAAEPPGLVRQLRHEDVLTDRSEAISQRGRPAGAVVVPLRINRSLKVDFPLTPQCDVYKAELTRVFTVLKNVFVAEVRSYEHITLVTHLSQSRLDNFRRLIHHWQGAVSVSIYLRLEHVIATKQMIGQWLSTRESNVDVHFVIELGTLYPVNLLRNLAVSSVRTRYVFLNDVDFLPSRHAEQRLQEHLYLLQQQPRQVLVLPAFEYYRANLSLDALSNKSVLDPQYHEPKPKSLGAFHIDIVPVSHRATNFSRWWHASSPYKIEYELFFEPYVVMRKSEVVPYDELFLGRYYDKSSYFVLLALQKYEFVVVPDVYVIHLYHPRGHTTYNWCSQTVWQAWRQRIEETFHTNLDKYDKAKTLEKSRKVT